MAGKNVVQKILARAAGKEEVGTGEYIIVHSNRPVTLDADHLDRGAGQVMDIGARKVFDPQQIKVVAGHAGAGGGKAIGITRGKIRRWAEEMGIPRENYFDLGQQGVEHIIAGEQGWVLPGELYFSVTNGHTSCLGALGGVTIPLSSESGAYLIKGFSWIQVPEVARFTLTGKTKKGVYARDVSEYILGQIGATGTPGQVMLWDGDYVTGLNMDGRFTLCANALFSSGWTAIIEPDQVTTDYIRAHSEEAFTPLYGDRDAEYAQHRIFDVSDIEPQIVPPPKRDLVYPLSGYEGTRITKGHIGACTNGRMDDMRVAAQILKGHKVHPDVMLNITPGSVSILRQCLQEGILEIFLDAGVFQAAPCCGQCASGSNTPLGDDDVCVSSGTCNYPGRMFSEQAQIYIGSPATIAASAVAGYITDPRNFL